MQSAVDEIKWCSKSTKLLLSLYMDRKVDFRDSKQKKKVVWQKICNKFNLNGLNEFTPAQLDRKFRNLKNTYERIKNKNKRTGQVGSKWQFYNQMKAIFSDDLVVSGTDTLNTPSKDYEQFTFVSCKEDEDTQSDSSSKEEDACSMSSSVNSHKRKRVETTDRRQYYSKKVANNGDALQTERFNKIMSAIEESNKLQAKRNELLEKSLAQNCNNAKKVANNEQALQTERFNKIMSAIEQSNKLKAKRNELLEKSLAKKLR